MSLFTIITVNLNNLSGLRKTKKSIDDQTVKTFEWIVIDGLSTDGSVEMLQNCQDVSWISEKDGGIYDAMNKGLHKSSGTYLIFLNSGDCFANSTVLEMVSKKIGHYEKLRGKLPDLVYGDSIENYYGDGESKFLYKKARNVDLIWYSMITRHQSIFFLGSRLNDLTYNTDRLIAADYEFIVRFYQKGITSLKVEYPISECLLGGISCVQWPILVREENEIRKEFLNLSFLKRTMIYLIQKLIVYLQVKHRTLYSLLYTVMSRLYVKIIDWCI